MNITFVESNYVLLQRIQFLLITYPFYAQHLDVIGQSKIVISRTTVNSSLIAPSPLKSVIGFRLKNKTVSGYWNSRDVTWTATNFP